MFNRIWKEQIVQPKSKVGIFKPKQGFDLEEDNDEDCCEKARKKWLDIIEKGWFGSWDFEKEYNNAIKFPNEKGTTVSDWNCGLLNDVLTDIIYHVGARNFIPGLANILDEWEECEKNVQ